MDCRTLYEKQLSHITRDGIRGLMDFLSSSDFYTAPTSTNYHLSIAGGLCKHSLNVYYALRQRLRKNEDGTYSYLVAGKEVARISEETLCIITLLHDLCKINFYASEKRNRKIDGIWQEIDVYTVQDQYAYGHGEKSVDIIRDYIKMTEEEKLAIRWHMGMPETYAERQAFTAAVEKYPIVWALHCADMEAAHIMEGKENNQDGFQYG